jgi:hypothetical protein
MTEICDVFIIILYIGRTRDNLSLQDNGHLQMTDLLFSSTIVRITISLLTHSLTNIMKVQQPSLHTF